LFSTGSSIQRKGEVKEERLGWVEESQRCDKKKLPTACLALLHRRKVSRNELSGNFFFSTKPPAGVSSGEGWDAGQNVSGFGRADVVNTNNFKAGNFHAAKAVEPGSVWQTAPLAGGAMATGRQHVDNLGRASA
jgi:hypothetical protein